MIRLYYALVVSLMMTGPALAGEVSSAERERNKDIVAAFEDEVFIKRNVDAILTYLAPDYVEHSPTVPVPTREGLLTDLRQRFGAQAAAPRPANAPAPPPPQYIVLAENDLVLRAREVQLDDPKAPGQKYRATAYDLYRLRDGKIVEHWSSNRR